MVLRIAGTTSLLAFAICLVLGGFAANNPFDTVVLRALGAMGGTFVVGLIIGMMAQRMLDESLAADVAKLEEAKAKALARIAERESILEVGSNGPTGEGHLPPTRPSGAGATAGPRRAA